MTQDFFERCKLLAECKILSFLYDIVETYQVFLMLSFTFVYCVLRVYVRVFSQKSQIVRIKTGQPPISILFITSRMNFDFGTFLCHPVRHVERIKLTLTLPLNTYTRTVQICIVLYDLIQCCAHRINKETSKLVAKRIAGISSRVNGPSGYAAEGYRSFFRRRSRECFAFFQRMGTRTRRTVGNKRGIGGSQSARGSVRNIQKRRQIDFEKYTQIYSWARERRLGCAARNCLELGKR